MNHFPGLEKLESYLADTSSSFVSLPQLKESEAVYNKEVHFKSNGNESFLFTLVLMSGH